MVNYPGGGPSLCLCRYLKSWTEATVWPSALSLYKNQSWDNSLGLFSLKISWPHLGAGTPAGMVAWKGKKGTGMPWMGRDRKVRPPQGGFCKRKAAGQPHQGGRAG
jgi:hypothetical protein